MTDERRLIRLESCIQQAASIALLLFGILCVLTVLVDSFETIVLPRTVKRPIRLTNLFFSISRAVYKFVANLPKTPRRQNLLVAFAPLMLLALVGVWATLMIVGFALMGEGLHTSFLQTDVSDLGNRLYYSGVTFFTLGYGDISPTDPAGKLLAVLEAGMGFGFLALIISYVPVLYNAFSRREVSILLLDSKAGSEPTGGEILRRYADSGCFDQISSLLKDWEKVAAQLLENYLSYPILAFYRSQHDDQSWLTALSAVMDASVFVMHCIPDDEPWSRPLKFQAKATFTMARHLVVDFCYVIGADPHKGDDRLPEAECKRMFNTLARMGLGVDASDKAREELNATRLLYEPYLKGLSSRLFMEIPQWIPDEPSLDNWQTSAWDGKHF